MQAGGNGRWATAPDQARPGLEFLFLVDAEGSVLAAGDALGSIGLPAGDTEGHHFSEAYGSWPPLVEGVEAALSDRRTSAQVKLNGEELDVSFEPRHDASGRVAGAVAIAQPRATDLEPFERSDRVKMFFRQIPGAVWTTDKELRVTNVVGRFEHDRRFPNPSLVGRSIVEILGTREGLQPVIASHRAAAQGQKGFLQLEYRGRWYELYVEPLRSRHERVVGVIGLAFDITERKRSEEQLERSEALLAEAQRLAHIGSWEWDVDRDVVLWSDELFRIYGLERGEFSGTFSDFVKRVHPEDALSTQNVILEALRKASAFTFEHRILRPDGNIRMLHTRGDVTLDAMRRPVRMVGSCWDITEQWDAKRALERSVSLLHATLDATADGILVVDRSGKIVAYNRRFGTLWGIPQDLVERRDDEAALRYVIDQLEDPDEFLRRVNELYSHPEVPSFDAIRFRDGRIFERYSLPQRVGDEIVGRVWSFRDVSVREQLLNRAVFLSDGSRLLASLDIEPALEGVGRLIVPALADALAIDLFDAQLGPRRLVTVENQGAKPIDGGLPRAVLAGHPTLYSISDRACLAVPILARSGLIGAIRFAAQERRRYEQTDLEFAAELAQRVGLAVENAQLYRDVTEALGARDEFLSIAAHEIRGPVTSLHLAVQSLQRGKGLPPATAKSLSIIEREDRRIARFVDELLDVARIRGGRLVFEFEEVDLSEILHDVASQLAPELARSRSRLSMTTDGPFIGNWDRLRLTQVVTNLLSNAIKFGLGKPIEVAVTGTAETVTLVVRDQGVGIPPAHHERIFEPFERAVSARRYGGLGLGLFIVRTIVHAMGGTIRVESQPHGGATFSVELPRRRP